MGKLFEIIKMLDSTELLVSIIVVLIFFIVLLGIVIVTILKMIYKNVGTQLSEIIKKEKEKWATVNTKLDEITIKLCELEQGLAHNNKSTVALIYHQCFNEAEKWKEKGYIDLGAKKYFDEMWNNYLQLGDGLGTEPKDIVDKLLIKN